MVIQQVTIKFLLILSKNIFYTRVKIENYNIGIDGGNFYDQSTNDSIKHMMKSEKYQQDKVMIIQQVVYWILLSLKKL